MILTILGNLLRWLVLVRVIHNTFTEEVEWW